jgi:hypothetical protein
MAKQYPLVIENVGSDVYAVMSKGHHDPDLFMTAVRQEYNWPLGNPEHVWIKSTPCNTGEYSAHYNIVEKGTRGAWPATYSWEAYGEEQYMPKAQHQPNSELSDNRMQGFQ